MVVRPLVGAKPGPHRRQIVQVVSGFPAVTKDSGGQWSLFSLPSPRTGPGRALFQVKAAAPALSWCTRRKSSRFTAFSSPKRNEKGKSHRETRHNRRNGGIGAGGAARYLGEAGGVLPCRQTSDCIFWPRVPGHSGVLQLRNSSLAKEPYLLPLAPHPDYAVMP